jgi:predicted permease
MSSFRSDLLLALRGMAAHPIFSALVAVTLGLGIGANAAIFSAVNGLLLRPSPFKDSERLIQISAVRGDAEGPLAVPELDDLKALPVIEDAAMYTDQGMYNASGFGTPEELAATITNSNLFRVLGVEPLIGSTFPATFDRARNFGLVISHGLWVRKFGKDPNIVGRTMTLDGAPGYTIYGVMPPTFTFPSHSELFRSSGISSAPEYYQRRDVRNMMVVARLKSETSLAQARDAIAGVARRLEREQPATNGGVTFKVTPINDLHAGPIRPYVVLLSAAAGLVLLIACVNVANLLLSRVIARERDLTIRVALGATRGRIVRQLVTESLLLAIAGVLVSVPVAWWGVRGLTAMVPVQLPPWMRVELDLNVAIFLAAVTIATGVLAGLLPALRAGASDLHASLKDGGRGASSGAPQQRLRAGLIVAEVALAFVLLTSAGLLAQTVWRLQRVPLGFSTANTLTFRVELGWAAYGTLEKTSRFHTQARDAMRQLGAVTGVTFDSNLPMSGRPRDPQAIRLYGASRDDDGRNPFVNQHQVGTEYFEVMGIPLLAGRGLTEHDDADSLQVAVVSQRVAARLWPNQDPIGQRFQFADTIRPDSWITVVGVSRPVLHHALDGDPGLDVYRPYTQAATGGAYYVVKTNGDPRNITAAATGIIGQLDPNQSYLDVQIYDDRIAARMWQRRLAGALFMSFAGLALVLAAAGLYGVLSEIVLQQRRDIGVRVALGAERADVLRHVLGRGLRLAVIGIAVGLPVALISTRGFASLLYGVEPYDPVILIAVAALLLVVATLACYIPARRALRIDPLAILRAG